MLTPAWGWRAKPQHFCPISVSPGTHLLWSFWTKRPSLPGSEEKWRTQGSQSLSTTPCLIRERLQLYCISPWHSWGHLRSYLHVLTWISVLQTGSGAALGRWHLPGHICSVWICGALGCHQVLQTSGCMLSQCQGEGRPLQSLSPWRTASLSPSVMTSVLLRSYFQINWGLIILRGRLWGEKMNN